MAQPKLADYRPGSNRTPGGATIEVMDRYLTLNGKPWLPVMGELHYSRVPAEQWEEEILKMKAAGVDIISAYVIWIHHEEVQGEWEWSDQRDLHRFAVLCAKHGMLFFPRIGPWSHGETRNGGFPDWVVKKGKLRQTDPVFMAETALFYKQIAAQLTGLLWKDGGPVVGVQIENEYVDDGPGKGAEYILALKKMAVADGLDVPLYTVTGWGHAAAPVGEVLPVYGGYPDAPWGDSRTRLPPAEVYAFRFGDRASGNMGLIGTSQSAPQGTAPEAAPFMTAEVGGGMQSTYHRRVTVDADDIAAMMPVLLGSGVNVYGTYMFHGGQNPDGKLSTLQESQATGYPSDLPLKSYDFEAPIDEFGLERPSLRAIKGWNYFLNDFGSMLAPMPAYRPQIVPASLEDLSVTRWSVRTDGHAGFLFLNNHVREAAMPRRSQVRFSMELPGSVTRVIPQEPIDIPAGAYFAWPFGLDLDGLPLSYATAQLVMRLGAKNGSGETFVFACVRGVRCEIALEEGKGLRLRTGAGVRLDRRNGITTLVKTGSANTFDALRPSAEVRMADGRTVSLLLLSPRQALNAWKIRIEGSEHLVETSSDVFSDNNSITLRQLGAPDFRWAVYHQPAAPLQASVSVKTTGKGQFVARVVPVVPRVELKVVRPAGSAPPVHLGQSNLAQLPADTAWTSAAAQWSIEMPGLQFSPDVHDAFLRIDYAGDSARLRAGGKLLADEFYRGEPWLVGLRRYARAGTVPPFELEVLPLRRDAPVYLPSSAQAHVGTTSQTVELDGVHILPQYQLKLSTSSVHDALGGAAHSKSR